VGRVGKAKDRREERSIGVTSQQMKLSKLKLKEERLTMFAPSAHCSTT